MAKGVFGDWSGKLLNPPDMVDIVMYNVINYAGRLFNFSINIFQSNFCLVIYYSCQNVILFLFQKCQQKKCFLVTHKLNYLLILWYSSMT